MAERSEAMPLSSVAPPTSPPPTAPASPTSSNAPPDTFAGSLAASAGQAVPSMPLPSPNAPAGNGGASAGIPSPGTVATPSARPARKKPTETRDTHAPEQRLLLLDTWQRSGLPAADFGEMVGLSKFTLYNCKARFDESGPEGLLDKPKGGKPKSKLTELTRRTILMLKERHPDWGCRRISDMLMRGPALPASESTVARVLHEAGYQLSEEVTEPHPDKVRSFERAKPNQLWQTDLFTFILKRQNRRVYLVAFMDDHSRFIVSYGLHASQSGSLVLEVLRAGIASYGAPQEILTDNGTQYVTWRGRSAFSKELQKLGVAHVVAKPPGQVNPEQQRIDELSDQIDQLQFQLQAARVREELALAGLAPNKRRARRDASSNGATSTPDIAREPVGSAGGGNAPAGPAGTPDLKKTDPPAMM